MYLGGEVEPQIYRSQAYLWPETSILGYIRSLFLNGARSRASNFLLLLVQPACLHESDLIEFAWFTDAPPKF